MKKVFCVMLVITLLTEIYPTTAYASADTYLYETIDGTVTITGCRYSRIALDIPSTIDGMAVTAIADNAFENGDYSSITIPNTVTSIGYMAFYGVTLSSDSTIFIPASVSIIGIYAFSYMEGVVAFEVDENNVNYASHNKALFSKDLSTLWNYPIENSENSFVVPIETTLLYCTSFGNAFNLKYLTVLNPNVRRMGYTFYGCDLILYGDNNLNLDTLTDSSLYGKVTLGSLDSAELGDINGDKSTNMQDVLFSYQAFRGKTTLSPRQSQLADVNSDGVVNMQDILLVYQYFRGKITSFD